MGNNTYLDNFVSFFFDIFGTTFLVSVGLMIGQDLRTVRTYTASAATRPAVCRLRGAEPFLRLRRQNRIGLSSPSVRADGAAARLCSGRGEWKEESREMCRHPVKVTPLMALGGLSSVQCGLEPHFQPADGPETH